MPNNRCKFTHNRLFRGHPFHFAHFFTTLGEYAQHAGTPK